MTSTGSDIESALDIIEANGGLGDFETDTESETEVQRWLFPRFKGATDPADQYMSRTGLDGYDTDVETLVGWLDAPRNVVGAILLIGPPGGGKTALIEAAATHSDRSVTTVLCTPDHTKDSLFLRFVGEGNGDCLIHGHVHVEGTNDFDETCIRSPYTLGPVPYAAKHGHLLYLDEAFMLVDGVKPVTYSLADGRRFLPEGNVVGSALEIHPDFRLTLSSNPLVRGASLPEPLASRCAGTTLTIETSASFLKDLGIEESLVAAWEALGTANLFQPQVREMRAADYWMNQSENPNVAQAVSAFIGEHCPESQRTEVKNTVVSFIGGRLRNDGRLVVS